MTTRKGKPIEDWPRCAPGTPDDYDWFSVKEIERELARLEQQRQNRIAKLRRLKVLWDAEDDERSRRRAAKIAMIVEQDKAWLERERLWEERLAAIQNYYLGKREKEEQAADKIRREKCARIGKDIASAAARTERAELIRRGVYKVGHSVLKPTFQDLHLCRRAY